MKERRNQIVELVNEQGAVSFALLKSRFPDVSEMTLRSDLKALDEQRLIVRVHGGAKSVERVIGTDDLFHKRAVRNVEGKRLIAAKAAKLIVPNSAIYLDSGSTLTELATVFPEVPCELFTTGLPGAMALAAREKVTVHVLGGTLDVPSLSLAGSTCCELVDRLHFDIAFMGVTGFLPETGFTCGSSDESALKRAVIARSERVVVLMDGSKVGVPNTFSFAKANQIDTLISDGTLDDDTLAYFERMRVHVL